MHQITTDIDIDAQPAAIWSMLMDFPSYPDWNPFIRRIEGDPVAGGRLEISIMPPDRRAMTFRPLVLENVENRILSWRGSLPVPGLFTGEHFLRLETLAPGRTRFIHGERFTGLLIPLLRKSLDGPVRAGFVEMNQALKSRAEHA